MSLGMMSCDGGLIIYFCWRCVNAPLLPHAMIVSMCNIRLARDMVY